MSARILLLACIALGAQDDRAQRLDLATRTNTWSIVFVDSRSREVAVAGASCYPDVSIIASTVKNVGAAATQFYWDGTNQRRVEERMLAGDSPQQIIDYVNSLDPQFQWRQYGIATLAQGVGNFTGTMADTWAGAVTGTRVTVQGNTLVGGAVINDTLTAFQNATTPLVDRLLRGLQAGQAAGGDNRCTFGADSAFIRIVRAEDGATSYCDLVVPSVPGIDPIAALSQQVQNWKQGRSGQVDAWNSSASVSPATIPADGASRATITVTLRDAGGNPLVGWGVSLGGQGLGVLSAVTEQGSGVYTAIVTSTVSGQERFTARAAGVTLGDTPTLTYTPGSDSDGDGLPDAWEWQYFGNLAQGPTDDPDGDGLTNSQEYAAGTDPTRPDTQGGSGGGGCGALGLEAFLLNLLLSTLRNARRLAGFGRSPCNPAGWKEGNP